jgi:catechol 2,3-dioxygenase-like lactoylglutathione lyase family enzyme
MPIGAVESVVYGTDDIGAAVAFYEEFGLPLVSRSETEAIFRLDEGSRVIIRLGDDPSLPAPHFEGNGVRETIFSIGSREELEELATSLATDREVRRDGDGTIHFTSDCGIPLGVRVWQRTPVVYSPDPVNAPDNVKRFNQHRRWRVRARPKTINHVVWRVKNFEESWVFFRDRLGFTLSDYQIDAGIFGRAPATTQHHSVYFQQFDVLGPPPHRTGFDHVCYGVEDVDELFAGWNYMARRGWANPFGGPGRHRISSAMFCYLFAPCGGMAEYGADTDYVDASWVPRRWERSFGGFMWTSQILPFLPEEVEWNVSFDASNLPDGSVPTKTGERFRPAPPPAADRGSH